MKWIKKIEIKGFRGISTNQLLKLAIPDGINNGSGLTVMVGPNGGGKSSFIEMLSLIGHGENDIQMPEDSRNKRAEGKVKAKITYSDSTVSEFDNALQPFHLRRVIGTDIPGKLYSVPSRRKLEKNFTNSRLPRAQYSEQSTRLRINRNEFPMPITRLVDLAQDPNEKANFDQIMSEVLGFKISWELALGQAGYYFKITTSLGTHDSTGLGFGIISLMFVLDAIRDLGEDDVVIIDEPELSQHPSIQRRLAKLLYEKATNNQIIIATHSPYFVDITAINYGCEVIRVAFTKYGTQSFQLTKAAKICLQKLINDLHNPHTIGLEAKEVLFLDENVILTEGQKDVVLLPKLCEQIGISLKFTLYGWGVGGAEKMKLVCRILKDLGLKNIIGLLDNDVPIVIRQLKSEFPRYKFFMLPAADIKDKKRKVTSKKDGLSNSSGKIYEQYKKDFSNLINQINSV